MKAPILTSDILTDLSSARLITFPEDLSDYIWGHPASVIERPPPAVISERNLWGADATMKRKMEKRQKNYSDSKKRRLLSMSGCVLTKITYIGTWTFPKYRNNT